jgi:hypothetical protein
VPQSARSASLRRRLRIVWGMSIIELFPWLLAICAAGFTGTILSHGGYSGTWVWIIVVVAGVASFAAYWLALKSLIVSAERRRARKEKSEREHRHYHDLDSVQAVGSELCYECKVCGNVIPSAPKKSSACKCRNIAVDAGSHRVEIRDRTKAKVFSIQ